MKTPASSVHAAPMQNRTLPDSPSIKHLKKEAKLLRTACLQPDPVALERADSVLASRKTSRLSQADALLVISREYGFSSWPRLKQHVEFLCLQKLEKTVPKQLPQKHDLKDIQKLADDLLAAVRSGSDASTVGAYLPDISPTALSPDDARYIVAREYGFATWRQLVSYVMDPALEAPVFEHLACLTYFQLDHPTRRDEARSMLASDPSLASRDIYAACCVGDVDAVRRFLDQNPALVNARGGYHDWEPILYACYSRLNLADRSTLDVVRLLLERGANANAYYMWGGQYRFTALTGAFGEGEMGPVNQPEHEQCDELAELLLAAGAHPNDSQALYNRMFTDSNRCLELLLAHGISNTDRANWLLEEGSELVEHPDQTLAYQLQWAVRNHHIARARLLIDHGADLSGHIGDGKTTFYEGALLAGHPELASYLAEKGAPTSEMTLSGQFHAACMAVDRERVSSLLKSNPGVLVQLQSEKPDLIVEVAENNRVDVMQLFIGLGADVNAGTQASALHRAAFAGHLDMVKLLVSAGADIHSRDLHFAGTPMQWALTGGASEVADYLSTCDIGIFDAILIENTSRVSELVSSDPVLLRQKMGDLHEGEADTDWMTPLAFAVLREKPDMVKLLIDHGADTAVKDGDGRSLLEIAAEQSSPEVSSALGA
jgi:ankyrin repeat protein